MIVSGCVEVDLVSCAAVGTDEVVVQLMDVPDSIDTGLAEAGRKELLGPAVALYLVSGIADIAVLVKAYDYTLAYWAVLVVLAAEGKFVAEHNRTDPWALDDHILVV